MIETSKLLEEIREFYYDHYDDTIVERISKKHIVIDFKKIIGFNPEMAEQLLDDPEETIRAFEIVVENMMEKKDTFRSRFNNLPKSSHFEIRELRPSKHLNKFISIQGYIRSKTDVIAQIKAIKYQCEACGNILTIFQSDKVIKEPKRCGCGKMNCFSKMNEEIMDAFSIVVEEAPEEVEGDTKLKRLLVLVKEDLTEHKLENKLYQGIKVLVNGIYKSHYVDEKKGKSTKLKLFLEANYIEPIEESILDIKINKEDEQKIIELSKDEKILQRLANSVFGGITGYDSEKEALILQLFGGVERKVGNINVRGDFHILLTGDPGSSKSTFLKIVKKIAPKARYMSGKGISIAGMTATVVKDELLGSWSLEAGALVLAHNGICCIDELNQVSQDDLAGLNECLEEQTISINKANIQSTLQAKTIVLAAANPKYGRFDLNGNLFEQINLPLPLINRFDFVFPFKDIPNTEKDRIIARTMLSRGIEEIKEDIPINLIKKYIIYAKRIRPLLSKEVIEYLADKYVGTRNQAMNQQEKIIPITPRQVDMMRRVSEAYARIRLKENVSMEEAEYALQLVDYNLRQIAFDIESGKIDIDKFVIGISHSTKKHIDIVKNIIDELESKIGKQIPIDDIITESKLKESDVEECLERLRKDGDIYEPRRGFIQKIGR